MQVHLVDGTYELFRQFLAPRPGHLDAGGVEIGATRAVVQSVLALLEGGATHLGVATDHVIESFRNDLWDDYKDGAGIDPLLFAQFPLLEEALAALGVAVWAMVEYEADDALASAAAVAAADDRVEQVIICTPDKDLGQCVGGKVVQLDRRKDTYLDADGVRAKFGVPPESIPDWLALVGDSADGFPGPSRLRRQDRRRAARALRPHRGDPRRRRARGTCRRARRRPARGDARGGPRGRRAVQGPRDAAHRRRRRRPSTTGSGRARRADFARLVRRASDGRDSSDAPTKLAAARGFA